MFVAETISEARLEVAGLWILIVGCKFRNIDFSVVLLQWAELKFVEIQRQGVLCHGSLCVLCNRSMFIFIAWQRG